MSAAPSPRNIPKLVRELQRRKAREERGMVIAEGRRLVADALGADAAIEALLVADDVADAARAMLATATARGIQAEVVARRDFDALADTETPSGVLAVIRWEPAGLPSVPARDPAHAPALIIDGVQDPGNVGTMIRTAFALGARCTIALDGTADVRSPKVVRAAMGALFRHPTVQATWHELCEHWGRGGPVMLLAVQDGDDVRRLAPESADVAIVVGSEGHGVRGEWAAGWPGTVRRVTVPMRAGAESLNAAVAAGILLHELGRGA